jgi:hypothetical protein
MSYRDYSTSKGHIVDATGHGDFTTIGAALTAASSGQTIFIRPGTYTENPTLKAGVNLVAFTADAFTPNVVILGECTAAFVGTCSISGIQLQTNSNYCLSVTGASSTVFVENCYISAANNTAINISNGGLFLQYCYGNTSTTGVAFINQTGGGTNMYYCFLNNSGGSATPNTTSSGPIKGNFNITNTNFESTASGYLELDQCTLGGVTVNGTTGMDGISDTFLATTTIGGGATLSLAACVLSSPGPNAIGGTGILNYGAITFLSNSTIQGTLTLHTYTTLP